MPMATKMRRVTISLCVTPRNQTRRSNAIDKDRGQALIHMITWKYIIQTQMKASIERIPPEK